MNDVENPAAIKSPEKNRVMPKTSTLGEYDEHMHTPIMAIWVAVTAFRLPTL